MLFSDLGQIGSSAMSVSYYNSVIAACSLSTFNVAISPILDYNNIATSLAELHTRLEYVGAQKNTCVDIQNYS